MKLPNKLLISAWTLSSIAWAQTTTEPGLTDTSEILTLETFAVNTDKDSGYIAADSLIGGRINTNIQKTPADITALTSEFLSDIASTNYVDAAAWLPNAVVTPPNANNGVSDFGTAASFRGISSGFQARNYFRYLNPVDAYITDRVESVRGPSALLFADGVVGGVINTLTKRARLGNDITTLQLRTDNEGTSRATVDVNRPLTDDIAVRLNLLGQEGRSWVDTAFDNQRAVHLAATWRVNPKGEVRVEGELAERDTNYAPSSYTDSASNWNGTTLYTGALAANPPSSDGTFRTGLGTRFVVGPAFGDETQNLFNFAATGGTGLTLIPEGRPFPGRRPAPRIARNFSMQPSNAASVVDYNVLSAFFEQGIGENFVFEIAVARLAQDRAFDTLRPTGYSIDVNRTLPNGAPNPYVGEAYVQAANFNQDLDNEINEYRVAGVYTMPINSFSQRINVLAGHRTEVFNNHSQALQVINAPAFRPEDLATANRTGANYRVNYRYYLKDGPGRLKDPVNGNGYTYEYIETTDSRQDQALTYTQVATVGSYWDDKLTLIAGTRFDDYEQTNRAIGTRDPVGRVLTTRQTSASDAFVNTSSLGATVFPIKQVGAYANYSETFNPVGSGSPSLSGGDFDPTDGTGFSYGLRFNLLNNRVIGSLGRYTVQEEGRVVGGPITNNVNAIRNIIGGDTIVGYRDTLNYEGEGYELDLVANVTKDLRLRANISFPETTQNDSLPDTLALVAAERATWVAASTNPAFTAGQRTTILNNIGTIDGAVQNANEGRTLNGTADYTANIFANYTIPTGALKRVRVGGGANFIGPQVIGNRVGRAFDYIYSDTRMLVTGTLGYSFKFQGNPVDVQLNITNLLNDQEPIYTGVSTFSGVAYRSAFYFPEPRKATVTVTMRF